MHFAALPDVGTSGVYFLRKDDEVVYVGQAVDMRRRVGMHLAEGIKDFNAAAFLPCPQAMLDRVERHYIVTLMPRYNSCRIALRAKRERDMGMDTGAGLATWHGKRRKHRSGRMEGSAPDADPPARIEAAFG